jgi:hypothetical protein
MVQDAGDEFVRVPLGLVALNWLRLYLPLTRESLPQTPTNVGAQGLGFAKKGFQTLLSGVSASDVELDTDYYLTAFGWMRVPGHLWRAMRRNAAWIEPTLIAEWMRLMREYARGQNRPLADTKMFAAMRWSDPARDVSRAREVALTVVEAGNLRCV